MSLNRFRKGNHVLIGSARFLILKKLDGNRWQLENEVTGEWCVVREHDLLDRFANNELVFAKNEATDGNATGDRALASYSPHLIAAAQIRVQYLKEIDRHQPIVFTTKALESLTSAVAERIGDANSPSWRTLSRDYRRWLAAGRDVRAIVQRHADRGGRGSQMLPEVRAVSDAVIEELYMAPERKRVPEVHLEIMRRIADANRLRPANDQLPIPCRRTIYREIDRRPPFEVMAARYGKRHAEMKFRVSSAGPEAVRALQRVSMDHTPGDLIVVDDNSMLPLGRPTLTSALDEYTRCSMGFYAGFEPPSCLSVMRCLKHAILPKTYVQREFPSVKNPWECYGVPELVVVDNPPEFHSTHFERACLQIGADIQYAKVLVPWYKGKLERFQGTMNHDLMHGNPGTTFSNILERDDYDPSEHAVVLLSTFREMLHKWIIDVYLQTPHRGITDTPAHCWHSALAELPPPLPPSASELDMVLGMTAQRVIFHYGVELMGLKYNGPELAELRRRVGNGVKVELTFDPGDLSQVNVLDPQKGTYFAVPAVSQNYTKGLSLWQHKVIRRFAQRQLNDRTDLLALAQAKADIRALVERDFNRKSTRGRKRHARFLEDHSKPRWHLANEGTYPDCEQDPVRSQAPSDTRLEPHQQAATASTASASGASDDVLPLFESGLDLPRLPTAATIRTADDSSRNSNQ
jgi:putative transposase